MSKLIVISNRLPVNITRHAEKLNVHKSIGGLATGLSSYCGEKQCLWIGWPGIHKEELSGKDQKEIQKILAERHCRPVFLTESQTRGFYEGFSNKTIWPLFHYFPQFAQFESRTWESYKEVNELFCREVLKEAGPEDQIWIHDYQLMLLPGLLREKMPHSKIGFFLHIPFPSFEIFRFLPWRKEILTGLLGADLLGFHTYDYVQHFLSSIQRLCGLENTMGQVSYGSRRIKIDAFPMGIDYTRYSKATQKKKVQEELAEFRKKVGNRKVIFSVDRLDYTKGIIERLEAFDWYLSTHPEMRGKVVMILLAVPSRTGVEHYEELRYRLEQLVGRVNGALGSIGWIPIWYLFRAVPFERLVALYNLADVALVTPLRDGMNLIAKEYVAATADGRGVLILSEMAGAANELPEALTINAFDKKSIVEAIDQALNMPVQEQKRRMKLMQDRLSRYNVIRWAGDFLDALDQQKQQQAELGAQLLSGRTRQQILRAYKHAPRRLLLLDYDGTLVDFVSRPEDAGPDDSLIKLLKGLADEPGNELVIISGRDRKTLYRWLHSTHASLIAEHGAWRKEAEGRWTSSGPRRQEWKKVVRPILEVFSDRTPGSSVEEKSFSLVWHYRQVPPDLALVRTQELKNALDPLIGNMDLGLFEGNKILEIKHIGIHKGRAAQQWLGEETWDFVLAAGDDFTDEDLFAVLPEDGYSIKIGSGPSRARYRVDSVRQFHELLTELSRSSHVTTG